MTTDVSWATGRERDARLVELFKAARTEASNGPAASELVKELRTVLSPLRRQYGSEVDLDELVSRAWNILATKSMEEDLSRLDFSCSWLLMSVRGEVNNMLLANRYVVAEDRVKSGELKRALEENVVRGGGPSMDRSADLADLEDSDGLEDGIFRYSPAPASGTKVWDELAELLVNLGWPRGVAESAVLELEARLLKVRVERGVASPTQLSLALPKSVPKGVRMALARFVTAHLGFVWLVLNGHSARAALTLPQVRQALPALVWRDS